MTPTGPPRLEYWTPDLSEAQLTVILLVAVLIFASCVGGIVALKDRYRR